MVNATFDDIVFVGLNQVSDIIRHQIDGLTSETLVWNIVELSPAMKPEFQMERAKYGVLHAYISAVKYLANDLICSTQAPGMMILRENSLCIPFLFLCRHTIELALKNAIEKITDQYPKGHRIINLWKSFMNLISIVTEDEKEMLTSMENLVKALDEYDPDGSQSRYAMSNNKQLYHEDITFIKVDLIADYVGSFANQLERLTITREE